ncbi:MAG: hypothetical protein OXT73_07420 [Bacteroidota bacterium]|nr:hypothetical protein [Bacteroidota bacterium]
MDYGDMTTYWQRLIELRMSDTGVVFRMGGTVPEDHYQWVLPENTQLLGYVTGEKVLVLMNTSWKEATFDVSMLPKGTWHQVTDGTRFVEDGCDCPTQMPPAEEATTIVVPARSAPIWVRQ